MKKVSFFARQETQRKLTRRLVVLTLVGVAAIAAMGGVLGSLTGIPYTDYADIDPGAQRFRMTIGAVAAVLITGLAIAGQALYLRHNPLVIQKLFHGRAVSHDPEPGPERMLRNTFDELVIAAGIPAPRLLLLPADESINSFAIGIDAETQLVGVSQGSLNQLSRDEMQGMIAHEIAHIANGDSVLNIRLLAIVRGFRFFYDAGMLIIRKPVTVLGGGSAAGLYLSAFLAVIFGPLVVAGLPGTMITRIMQSAIARTREHLADASAIQFTRAQHGLLGALTKAGNYQRSRSPRPTNAGAFMMFVSPYRESSWLLRTHPKIKKRIKAVQAMKPGIQ